jgi:serine/threonine protein kinase/Tol biopolymer transport system component
LALTVGTRLGAYEVTAQIGEGGMGQVYRATDTKLKRQVAIKVLPTSVAADHDRLARFQREAEVLASLNHPNIAGIYGLEESAGMTALVMELVEGEDLSAIIARGPIPVADALPIAKQIADALEAAHEQGIIHRDLKPANIKIKDAWGPTPARLPDGRLAPTRSADVADGTVKVLDFGLAKAMDPAGASSASASALANSPTITSPAMTAMGIILGTAAYMSPEQAKGRVVDKRSDVWAFGAVLYEMLTGRRAFEGEDISDTLARILMKEPDWTALPATVPPRVVTVLRRCLQKDRRQRARDIGDVALALDGAFETAAPQTMSAPSPPSDGRLAWAVAAVLGLALAGVSVIHIRETPTEAPHLHLAVTLPENVGPGFFALSPDGLSLVMWDQNALAVRSLESGETRPLTGTALGRAPFWSPDSRAIAFFGDRKLKTMPASGGPPRTLCEDVGTGGGGTWNRAGVILFATDAGVLTRVPATGGACTGITKPEAGERRRFPVFLPDGDHFLYLLEVSDEARRGLYVASLSDAGGRRLLADQSSGIFVPSVPGSHLGRLLFVRELTLMAQTFDATSLVLSGEPVTVARPVGFTFSAPQIAASADANGTLMYLLNGRPDRQLVWYDRSGTARGRGATIGSGTGTSVALAPDGKRVAFRRTDSQGVTSLWMEDLERNLETRLTTPPVVPGAAVWSPDGQRVAFGATGAGASGIYVKSVNGGTEKMLLPGSSPLTVSDWSRDGHWLVFTENNPKTGGDIWRLAEPSRSVDGQTPVPLVRTPAIESEGQISADGKWLAYVSDESGTDQVYLRPFGGPSSASGTTWQVSNASEHGAEPRWRADGRELFYLDGIGVDGHKMMAVPIGAGPNPVGTPKALFQFWSIQTVPQANSFLYAPAPDGQRFLVNVNLTEAQPSLDVILNWGATLGK